MKFVIDKTALLVVDLQEKLLPAMHDHERVLARSLVMLKCAKALGVGVVTTQQYPRGLGETVKVVRDELEPNDVIIDKTRFSACTDKVMGVIESGGYKSVLVMGVEAHVCVMQSCLDLKAAGYHVGVVVDAIGSRNPLDWDTGIARFQQRGIELMTVESAVFELVGDAKAEGFKKVLPLIQ
ncbi:Isochorismatase family protein [Poriferisphaera corsica]|uniref:Isochorismatase family protein n=1 Tax=Poriferisphaera corsica TaxID=2528020 RepID=A0A517YU92_9BACT|nr:isochorismatase family protein [Poriferisphaera corsica]QDU33791.1 Isochorismatase family protein [Poriferisphaera corsica]